MDTEAIYLFQVAGQDLFAQGLVSYCSGNLSMRRGERLIITHRGSSLGSIKEADLVEIGIARDDRAAPLASSELAVHRSIYKNTSALAVVHAHPLHSVALSFGGGEVVPRDIEGQEVLSRIPILGKGMGVKAGAFDEGIAGVLKEYKVILVWGHGSFAVGQSLQEACYYTAVLEQSCHLLCWVKALGINPDTGLL